MQRVQYFSPRSRLRVSIGLNLRPIQHTDLKPYLTSSTGLQYLSYTLCEFPPSTFYLAPLLPHPDETTTLYPLGRAGKGTAASSYVGVDA